MELNDIVNFDNIILSFRQCLRGKYEKRNALLMFKYFENDVLNLYNDLKNRNYRHSGYNFFVNYDSKKRRIASACLIDKIVHRMLYNKLNDIFDSGFIFDNYACRDGKGTSRAITRCQKFLRNKKLIYFLKSDVKKYFDSIDHNILKELLRRKIKNDDVIYLLDIIINSYSVTENRGIPIGNLTSQMFANIYLNELDQFVKHKLKVKYYIRYMDDFIILSGNKEELKFFLEEINKFLLYNLKLEISNKNIILAKSKNGVVFLGKRIFWDRVYILNKTKKILRHKIHWLKKQGALNINSEDMRCIGILYSYFNYIKHYQYKNFNFYTRIKIARYYNYKLRKLRNKE